MAHYFLHYINFRGIFLNKFYRQTFLLSFYRKMDTLSYQYMWYDIQN